ncbi:distal membrane-arm assembly complex protein 2 [Wyeomyia smithii]|uniref:distal membrane-arm assembly complex protein 2 n=1 Tax=Wyeomyia smithii TaxID=174621 RepID=UPI0024681AEB|nr:distal membrane-arm assembly complex protein 2 [Wyeomyia smithii]
MLNCHRNLIAVRTLVTAVRQLSGNQLDDPKLAHIKEQIEEDKKKLQWQVPFSERPDIFKSTFKLFEMPNRNSELLEVMQQPVDVSPAGIKKWWTNRRTKIDAFMQKFIPERHAMLGEDLATAHFVVHRGGSVRFRGEQRWVKMDDKEEYDLPKHYVPNMVLEEVKCDNMTLYYEGLENIRRLGCLKHLSFRGVANFDDWFLDRVSGSGFPSLEVLDLRGTAVTEKGLHCLYRLPSLKTLLLDDSERDIMWKLTVALLEEWNPKMEVKTE